MHHAEHYPAILAFLRDVGLRVHEAALPADTFLPGIRLVDGGLVVDPERLAWPGDLLHEAGHLAVLPPDVRAIAHDDLVDETTVPHAGEPEAMAWAWAAAMAIGLPPDVLLHEGGYHARSRDILQMYAFGIYPGLRGLCEAGLAEAHGFTPVTGDAVYPAMRRWLRG